MSMKEPGLGVASGSNPARVAKSAKSTDNRHHHQAKMSTFCTLNGSPSAPDALSTLLFCGSCAQSCVSASGVTTNSLASFSLAPALNSLATTASVTLTQSLDSLAAPAFISESTAAFALAQSSAATTKSIASCPLGSLLVAITSNYHLAIFSPAKHPSTGEWLLVGNLLPLLMQSIGLRPWNLEYNRIETLDSARASLLESTALGWSEVWIDSATSKHAYAFLGIGSKEGTVTLWRFSNENLTAPSYQAKIKPQSGWCTKVAWSQWVSVGGIQYCYLLCGYDNGAVYHHTITFDPFTHTLNASSSTLLTPADNKTASVIKFYTTHTTPLIRAAIAKGATLHVWTAPTPTHPSTSTDFGAMHALRIPCTMPVGGITWSLAGDEMRVYTMDGRALVLAVLPEAPLAAGMGSAGSTPPPEEDATSASATAEGPASGAGVGVQVALLEDLTAQFYKEILGSAAASAAEEDADEAGAAAGTEDAAQSSGWQVRFYGAVSSPHGLVDCVLYTMSEYEGLEYRTERHNNCFVLLHWNVGAGSLGAEVEAGVMQRVRELVARDDLLYRVSPATLLWDIVAHASLHREAPAKAGTPPVPTPATTAPTVTIVHRVQAMLREFFLSQQDVVEVNLDGADKGNPHHVLHQVPRILFSNSRMNCLRLQNHLMLSMMVSCLLATV
ncbi:hypothetical protein BC830DRAFT_262205 [Chytriomyces sp. MP71]|nr:hypothetical protein BC830DRAFT_262205 [Chytriomyces sp. MP71]